MKDKLDSVEILIETRFRDSSFCIKDICNEFNMSMSSFHEVLSMRYGTTPHILIETRKLIEAINLMKENHLRFCAIVSGSGFSTIRTFRRAFERRLGVPPSKAIEKLRSSSEGDKFHDECIQKLLETGG